MKKYKKRKKYPGKMTKSEMLKFENERLKWEVDKNKEESNDFVKAILFIAFLMLLSYFFGSSGPAWKL
ncbi:hypothetical protein OAY15_01865 [Candidatus Pelagibacter sp.]|jgi:hypothetical protein|nr:hypothetical protein [Candidatus Pelagibacter sp.]|tara:strand:+ start:247 stop:450 length:204 start_codon:yes stop_codon:yes gene_type:complete